MVGDDSNTEGSHVPKANVLVPAEEFLRRLREKVAAKKKPSFETPEEELAALFETFEQFVANSSAVHKALLAHAEMRESFIRKHFSLLTKAERLAYTIQDIQLSAEYMNATRCLKNSV